MTTMMGGQSWQSSSGLGFTLKQMADILSSHHESRAKDAMPQDMDDEKPMYEQHDNPLHRMFGDFE